ncbi:MAG: hypothetical protein Q4C47_02280, partial [Planctomycetia bacterium]|nr:hypothetical protein [Planctomycetia bacterium]
TLLSAGETTNWEFALADVLNDLPTDKAIHVRFRDGILRIMDLRENVSDSQREVIVRGYSGEYVRPAELTETSRLTVENARIPIEVAAVNGGTEIVEGTIRKIELTMTPELPDREMVTAFRENRNQAEGPAGPQGTPGTPGVPSEAGAASGAPRSVPGNDRVAGISDAENAGGNGTSPEYPVLYELRVDAPDVPLSVLSPFSGRLIPGMTLEGVCGADLRVIWRDSDDEPIAIHMEGQLNGWETRLHCDSFGDDRPYFDVWTYTGTLEYRDGTLYCGDGATPAVLDWGWGRVSVNGALLLMAADRLVNHPEELLADILAARTSIQATIQVPEFLRNFATLFHVRSDVTAESGTINLNMTSAQESAGISCTGKLTTDDLRFVQNGQAFDFGEPMTLDFDAIRRADGVQLRNLTAKTKFCDLTASGNRRAFSSKINFNFLTMQTELGRFLDLSGWTLSGSGESRLSWEWKDDQTFVMTWATGVDDFVWNRTGGASWSERRIDVTLTADGTSDGGRGILSAAALTMTVTDQSRGTEQYTVALAEPFDASSPDAVPLLKLSGRGTISRWVSRLQGIDGVQLGGKFDGSMTLRTTKTAAMNPDGTPMLDSGNRAIMKNTFGVEDLTVDLDNLTFRSDGKNSDFARWCGTWNISDEPALRFNFSGTIHHDRRIQIQSASFLSWESVEARQVGGTGQLMLVCGVDPERGMKIRQVSGVWTLDGKLLVGGDLNRLWRWRFTPTDGTVATKQVYGSIDASLDCVVRTGTLVEPVLTATVKNFRLTDASGRILYQDPQLTLSAQGAVNQTEGNLTIAEASLASRLLTADARGSLRRGLIDPITGESSPMQINLAGTVSKYDMNQIGSMVSSELGAATSIQGSGTPSPFEIRLPLSREDAVLSGSFSWSAATISGLEFGPATLRCSTPTPGTIFIDPFEVTVSGGKLSLSPTIRTTPWPLEELTTTSMPVKEGGNFSMSLWDAVVPAVTQTVTPTTERVISLTPGTKPIVDRVRFSTKSNQGLSLFLPALAGAADASGSFSVYVDRAEIPLTRPSQADVWGWIDVHDLTVTSGNLLSVIQSVQLSGTATSQRSRIVATIPEGMRTIPFRICRGRIAYLPTPLTISRQTLDNNGQVTGTTQSYVINTSGSIGFDRTVQLMIDMPIPEGWTKNEYFVHTALANQRLLIPVTGTLDRPALDESALQQYWKVLVQRGAENVITDQLSQLQMKFLGELGNLMGSQTTVVDPSGNQAIAGLGLGTTTDTTGTTGTATTGSDLLRNFLDSATQNLQRSLQQNVGQGLQELQRNAETTWSTAEEELLRRVRNASPDPTTTTPSP